jgi:mitogen-activated protein kinase kinase
LSTAVGTKKVFSYDPSLNATLSHIEQLLHDISLSVGLTDLLVQDRHWSDDVLKEICPVGENEGRTMVTKVQDKRTNRILARKALSVFHPWAPGSQLLQDLTRISSIQHINIIQFVGGYVSPTSHHIVLLLDFSEGGSLESIAKQLSVKGMAIAESIVGRIAEGVGNSTNSFHIY